MSYEKDEETIAQVLDPGETWTATKAKAKRTKAAAVKSRATSTEAIRPRVQKITALLAKAHADGQRLTATATSLVMCQKALEAEITTLLRVLQASEDPNDKEAAQGVSKLKMSLMTNARMVSGIIGASRQMHNLKNFQLIVE